MPKSFVAAVAVAAILLSACGGDRSAPIEAVTPTPWPGDVVSSTPTAAPTPSQEELSAEAERVYRALFEERVRLELQGGALEPTPAIRDHAGGDFLLLVERLLREQKERGAQVQGAATVKVVAAPGGNFAGVDPRLTLNVCEDHRHGSYTLDGVTHRGGVVQGTVYLGVDQGLIKVIAGSLRRVETCTL